MLALIHGSRPDPVTALNNPDRYLGIRARAQSSAREYGLAVGISRYLDLLDGSLSFGMKTAGQSTERELNLIKSLPGDEFAGATEYKGEMA